MMILKEGKDRMLAIITYFVTKIKDLIRYKPKKVLVTRAIEKSK